jgi:hypothetical protein
MDPDQRVALAALLRSQRTAALGTLRDGAPFVSLVAYAPAPDLSLFWLHLSGLAVHTRALLADPRAGLLIAEADQGGDPQQLARVSIQAEAAALPKDSPDYPAAKALYLAAFPEAAQNFALGDFDLYRLRPILARYVAGFGQIFNLSAADFRAAGQS